MPRDDTDDLLHRIRERKALADITGLTDPFTPEVDDDGRPVFRLSISQAMSWTSGCSVCGHAPSAHCLDGCTKRDWGRPCPCGRTANQVRELG